MEQEIVVTGRGVVGPRFHDRSDFESLIFRGSPVQRAPYPTDRDWLAAQRPKALQTTDSFTTMASLAVGQALEDAGLLADFGERDLSDVGLVMGTFFGPAEVATTYLLRLHEKGPLGASPAAFIDSHFNMAAGNVSSLFGLRGPVLVVSGSDPFSVATSILAHDDIPIVVGGTDQVTQQMVARYSAWRVHRELPEGSLRPFSLSRGLPDLCEGSAYVVLENASAAQRRGAHIAAHVVGQSLVGVDSALTFERLAQDPGPGIFDAYLGAMRGAWDRAQPVACIVASANASRWVDGGEAMALAALCLDACSVVPPKAWTGECFASGGALAIIAALSILDRGTTPAYVLSPSDNEYGLDFGVRTLNRDSVILSNSICATGISTLAIRAPVQ